MDREVTGTKAGPADAEKDEPTMAEVLSEYIFGPLADFTKEEEPEIAEQAIEEAQ